MQNNNRRMDAIATACFVFEDGCTFFIKNGDENMGNLMTSFNAGVSGLHSAQQSLTVTSHNLANAGTVGYTRQQVLVTDSFIRNRTEYMTMSWRLVPERRFH